MSLKKTPWKVIELLRAPKRWALERVRRKTVIGKGHRILGEMTGRGHLEIHGEYDGTLRVDGRVVLGKSARFTGALSAARVIVGGVVEGEVSAKQDVVLLSTSRMKGDIRGHSVAIQPGAHYGGNVNMSAQSSSDTAEILRPVALAETEKTPSAKSS